MDSYDDPAVGQREPGAESELEEPLFPGEQGEFSDEGDLAGFAPDSDAAERMRALVAYLASNLVDDPNAVEVETRQRGSSVFVSLRVPEEELGKVIGRGGRIARAMRTALMISGARSNVRASLDIED